MGAPDINLDQAPVVQMFDSAIHRINCYPVDNYLGNQLHYPLDRDYPPDSTIHLLNNWAQELLGAA